MKRLIVNADDFGMTPGINRGIIDCCENGIVTSATLMVNGEAAAEAAAMAARCPQLGVGLHLNLTDGLPASRPAEVTSLLSRDGVFPGVGNIILRLTTGAVDRHELEAEIAAQTIRCRDLGVEPTHIDSHHHVHAHPVVRAALTRVCARLGIDRARGFRLTAHSAKAACIMLAGAIPVASGSSLRTPSRFAGIEEMGKRDIAGVIRNELSKTGDTMEYMCHPGYADATLRRVSSYNDLREVELRAMMSPEVARVVEAAGAELVSFGEL